MLFRRDHRSPCARRIDLSSLHNWPPGQGEAAVLSSYPRHASPPSPSNEPSKVSFPGTSPRWEETHSATTRSDPSADNQATLLEAGQDMAAPCGATPA